MHFCVCSEPLREFSPAFCWRSNTSFVLVGGCAQHPPGESVPWSMVATCWHFSPWCLRHKHTSLRFFLTQLPPCLAYLDALYFWMQNLTDHIEIQSIFLLLWRSKRALFMCFLVYEVLQLKIPSVITAPCNSIHPCSFVCMKCLLSTLLLCIQVNGLHVGWIFSLISLSQYQFYQSLINSQSSPPHLGFNFSQVSRSSHSFTLFTLQRFLS